MTDDTKPPIPEPTDRVARVTVEFDRVEASDA